MVLLLYNILSIVRENPGCGSGEVADGLGIDIDVDKILGEYRDRGYITYDDVGGCILNIRMTKVGNEVFYSERRMIRGL